MIGKTMLNWMVEHDRTVGFLARQSGMDPDAVVELIAGETTADIAALIALERAMGLPEGALQREAQSATGEHDHLDSLRCYTVKQIADRMA